MNVYLTEELEKLVRDKVSSGRYNSASEVVREALRLLEKRDEAIDIRLSELRDKLDADVDDEEVSSWGADAVIEKVKQHQTSSQ
jgi:antitoxin ParD1/3/4